MAKYIIMPKLGFNMKTGVVAGWLKQEGDSVAEQEVILEVETDKTVMEVEAQASGILRKILIPEGEEVPVTLPIGIIADEKEDISQLIEEAYQKLGKKTPEPLTAEKPLSSAKEVTPDITHPERSKRISPRARRKAKELGVDLELVPAGSPDGKIAEKDVIAYHQEHKTAPKVAEGDRKIPYTGMRKIIGDRLSKSKFTAPHLYFTLSIDMTQAMALLKKQNQGRDQRISINDFLIFTTAKVLTEQPAINCSLLDEAIVYHQAVHIGIAVALEEGLIVPVLKQAHQKSLVQVARETKALIRSARERSLIPEDYQGGTFTISNLGMYGIEHFTAIINPPEAAILAVGAIKKMPVVSEEGQITLRSIMQVTLSVDHRLIDGAIASAFLRQLKDHLEFPGSGLF